MISEAFKISKKTLSVVWMAFNAVLMLTLLFAAYGGYIDPEKTIIPQLMNLVFPLIVAGAVLMLIVNLFVKRSLALAWLIALVACGEPIITFSPLNFTASSDTAKTSADQFTLLTYNTFNMAAHDGENPSWGSKTMAYIIADSADIVCIQEAGNVFSPYAKNPQTDSLKRIYPYIPEGNPYSSNMVLSKFPIKEIALPLQDWGSGRFQAYWVQIPALSSPLMLINTHLQSFQLSDSDKSVYIDIAHKETASRDDLRQVKSQITGKLVPALKLHADQARSIASLIDSLQPENVIVCGDFNDVCGSYGYRYLRNQCNLDDAYTDTAFGPTATYNDSKLYFHIDQMLYRGQFKPVALKQGRLRSSDHYPLTALFQCEK